MIISVEGSIGAGKTTLLDALQNVKFNKEHVIFFEPVDEWLNYIPPGSTTSLFELYYKDKQKYGFAFQMYVLQSRFTNMLKVANENPDKIIICERSHITDSQVFADMLYQDKIITEMEYDIYKKWYTLVCDNVKKNIDACIYLRVIPDVCVNRIAKRNRKGEDNIDIKYINTLHQLHDKWLLNVSKERCLVLDGNPEWLATSSEYINTIQYFINSLIG